MSVAYSQTDADAVTIGLHPIEKNEKVSIQRQRLPLVG